MTVDPYPSAPLGRLMLVGTFHFAAEPDVVTYEVDDMRSARRQAELDDLVGRLARYRPTKVLVEGPYDKGGPINANYKRQRNIGRAYLRLFPRMIAGDDFCGADMTGNWYHRNVRIYANILRIVEPGARLLIVYGSDHVPILRHLFEAAGEFTVDDPLPYLTADAVA